MILTLPPNELVREDNVQHEPLYLPIIDGLSRNRRFVANTREDIPNLHAELLPGAWKFQGS